MLHSTTNKYSCILPNNTEFLLLRFIFRVSVVEDLQVTLESMMSNLKTAEFTLLKANRWSCSSLSRRTF